MEANRNRTELLTRFWKQNAANEGPGMHKVTKNQLASMRDMFKSGCFSDAFIAERYNVTRGTVWSIRTGLTYKEERA